MERMRYPYKPPRPSTGRPIAWLALFFSFLAFLTSAATLLLTWHEGELAGRLQSVLQGLRRPAEPAAEIAAAPPRPAAPSPEWDRLRDKLGRAEQLIGNRDGQARPYLDGLRADLDQLRRTSSEKGAALAGEAAEKLKAIREQVAVNGPEAIRRLRQLSADLQQQLRNLQRAGELLHALNPGAAATPGAAAPAQSPAEAP